MARGYYKYVYVVWVISIDLSAPSSIIGRNLRRLAIWLALILSPIEMSA